MRPILAVILALACLPAFASDWRSVAVDNAVLYDAPSAKGKKLFLVKRYTPVEVVVTVEGFVKVRDMAGDIAWIERNSLSETRTVVVTEAKAEVRQRAEDTAPVAFVAAKNVALEMLEATSTGWIKVKHRDGASGWMMAKYLWGL